MRGGKIMEILITEINSRDEITFRTTENIYRFCVTNPRACMGFLTGGVLGQQRREAYFAGSFDQRGEHLYGSKRIETGTRALFFLRGKQWVHRLTTSLITELACRPIKQS
jgi:hypothetical protein